MKLYETLAAEYTEIFPSSQEKVDFVESCLDENGNQRILDIGCASGEFVYQLSHNNREIVGIDLDHQMIERARTLFKKNDISFIEDDMVNFLSHAVLNSYDTVCCMGNTLAYLEDEEQLKEFLQLVKTVLKKQGKLILQILNYSNPAIGPGFQFPVLESEKLVMERAYGESSDQARLDFNTKITNKITGETGTDVHYHYHFLSKSIELIAGELGYSAISRFGNYSGKEADTTDFFHLLVLEK